MLATAATVALVALAAAAAWSDLRRRRVSNRLVLLGLGAALAVRAATLDPVTIGLGVAGAAVGLALLLPAFAARWVGGGDVKLLAAIGAVVGAGVGLEGELFAFALAAAWALVVCAARGGLGPLLRNTLRLVVNPLVPAHRRRPLLHHPMMSLRLGVFVLIGLGASLGLDRLAAGQG